MTTHFEELKAYVGFTADDSRVLREAWAHLEPAMDAVVDDFYARVHRTPDARAVFADAAQVERLKVSLRRWLMELFVGPHDDEYDKRRRAIGRRHVHVQLPNRFMFTAMSGMRMHLRSLVAPFPGADAALDKLLDLELAIMTGTYLEESERDHLTKLRGLIVANLPSCVLVLDDDGVVTSATMTASPSLRGNPVGRTASDAVSEDVSSVVDVAAAVARARVTRQLFELPRVDLIRLLPFFTTKTRGTGLGLPMARRITEAMHGKLDLLPAEGRGCAFRISLTRQEAT